MDNRLPLFYEGSLEARSKFPSSAWQRDFRISNCPIWSHSSTNFIKCCLPSSQLEQQCDLSTLSTDHGSSANLAQMQVGGPCSSEALVKCYMRYLNASAMWSHCSSTHHCKCPCYSCCHDLWHFQVPYEVYERCSLAISKVLSRVIMAEHSAMWSHCCLNAKCCVESLQFKQWSSTVTAQAVSAVWSTSCCSKS